MRLGDAIQPELKLVSDEMYTSVSYMESVSTSIFNPSMLLCLWRIVYATIDSENLQKDQLNICWIGGLKMYQLKLEKYNLG